jgi:hypothetical protein
MGNLRVGHVLLNELRGLMVHSLAILVLLMKVDRTLRSLVEGLGSVVTGDHGTGGRDHLGQMGVAGSHLVLLIHNLMGLLVLGDIGGNALNLAVFLLGRLELRILNVLFTVVARYHRAVLGRRLLVLSLGVVLRSSLDHIRTGNGMRRLLRVVNGRHLLILILSLSIRLFRLALLGAHIRI